MKQISVAPPNWLNTWKRRWMEVQRRSLLSRGIAEGYRSVFLTGGSEWTRGGEPVSLLNVMSSSTTWWQAAFTVSIDFIPCCASVPQANPSRSGDPLLSASCPNTLIKIITFINTPPPPPGNVLLSSFRSLLLMKQSPATRIIGPIYKNKPFSSKKFLQIQIIFSQIEIKLKCPWAGTWLPHHGGIIARGHSGRPGNAPRSLPSLPYPLKLPSLV